MNYLVLARKYRPQVWDDIVAQEHVTATFKNAIEHNRLAHAYLFNGPRGVGKTTAARILAKTLNCEKAPTINPCNSCTNCEEITKNRSVDVFEIDGASNRGIDEVRNLRENIRYMPARGQYKVYIIDEVHMLTNEAFNALLKTLEEPPAHVIFIFATTEPHKVPATIVSRCQRFDFRRISTQYIMQQLTTICEKESITIEQDALLIIARKADGGMRDALSILDQIISFTGGNITTENVVKGLGLIEDELYFKTTDIIIQKDTTKAFDLIETIVSHGYDVEEFLIGLSEHLRNVLIVRGSNSTDLVEATEAQKTQYVEIAKSFQEEDLLRLIRIVLDAIQSLKQAVHPRLPLELALVKMIKLDQTVTINEILNNIGKAAQGGNSGSMTTHSPPKRPILNQTPTEKKQPESLEDLGRVETTVSLSDNQNNPTASRNAIVDHVSLTFSDIESKWEQVICQVKSQKVTIGSFLNEGVLLDFSNNEIIVAFGSSNTFHMDSVVRSETLVKDVIHKVYGQPYGLKCIKKDGVVNNRVNLPPKEKKKKDFEALIEEEPIVKKIVTDFDTELVNRS